MGWGFARETIHKAQKEYYCEAWNYWIRDSLEYIEDELTPEERMLVENLKSTGGKINKGDLYLRVTGVYDGEWGKFIAIPEADELAKNYDLYQE
jgi:hypothetical protein